MTMEQSRLNLHEILVTILGSRNVYFQSPESVKLKFPCIIYNRSDAKTKFADDQVYGIKIRYTIMCVDSDPDSEICQKIIKELLGVYDRRYVSSNLNHEVCKIYY